MEELRSTEILDREIHDDARKKAGRILQDSESECSRIAAAVTDRIEKARREKETAYKEKAAAFEKNALASLPLEKIRCKSAFVNAAVSDAVSAYLQELPHQKQLALLRRMLEKYRTAATSPLAFPAGQDAAAPAAAASLDVTACGIPAEEAEKLVHDVFGTTCTAVCSSRPASDIHDTGMRIGIAGNSVVCRAVFGELIAELRDAYMSELSDALFDGRLPE